MEMYYVLCDVCVCVCVCVVEMRGRTVNTSMHPFSGIHIMYAYCVVHTYMRTHTGT